MFARSGCGRRAFWVMLVSCPGDWALSPPLWGCSERCGLIVLSRVPFPTVVGVFRFAATVGITHSHLPRRCGGAPA